MNQKVTAYGLEKEQRLLLEAALPEGYALAEAACVTDLIVADGVCSIVDGERLDKEARNVLLAYYMDVGGRLDETVVWLGEVQLPALPSFVRCSSFLELLMGLDGIIAQARVRYDTLEMFRGGYDCLPKRAIEESIEADVHGALRRKYGSKPDPLVQRRVRRELTALREWDGFADLAAAFELSRWLKSCNIPFFVEYAAPGGLIPNLLGITHTNPLPPHTLCPECHFLEWHRRYEDGYDIPAAACSRCGAPLCRDGHDRVWRNYCGPKPRYGFWLPASVRGQIGAWLEKHWLKQSWEDFWGPAVQDECRMRAGPFCFVFAPDGDDLPGPRWASVPIATHL